MSIWMSLPSIVIPESTTADKDSEIDPLYQRIFRAFLHSTEKPEDGLSLPRAFGMDGEELAAAAMKPLLTDHYTDWAPDMLVDCRSSAAIGSPAPTYKLAATTNLTTVLPILLQGQAGAEVAHALIFLQQMGDEMGRGCILSAVQRVVPPDGRVREDGFPLADAAAAIAVSNSPIVFAKSFRVLSVVLAQRSLGWRDTLETVLDEALGRAETTRETIRWSLAHRLCDSFLLTAREALPDARWLVRDLYSNLDFGCADPLISLYRLFGVSSRPPIGIGVVWFAGRFGAVGAVLLDSQTISS